jgi:hypothetical protein
MGNEKSKDDKIVFLQESAKLDRTFSSYLKLNQRKNIGLFKRILKKNDTRFQSLSSLNSCSSLKILKSEKIVELSSRLIFDLLPKICSKNTNLNMISVCLSPNLVEHFTQDSKDNELDQNEENTMYLNVKSFALDLPTYSEEKFIRFTKSNKDLFESIKNYLKKSDGRQITNKIPLKIQPEKSLNIKLKKSIYVKSSENEELTDTENISRYDIIVPITRNKSNKTMIYDMNASRSLYKRDNRNNKSHDKSIPKGSKFPINNKKNQEKSNFTKKIKEKYKNTIKEQNNASHLTKSIFGSNRMDYSSYIQGPPINFNSNNFNDNYETQLREITPNKSPRNNIINNYNIKINQVLINQNKNSNSKTIVKY